jgi:hypothetical protein
MVNKTILELEQVFTSHTHAETIELLNELVSLRDELTEIQISLIEEGSDEESIGITLSEIEEQKIYLNRNIMTLEDAIMLHESKTFEKKSSKNGIATFCLN